MANKKKEEKHMTSEQHIDLWKQHRSNAMKALKAFQLDIHNEALWLEYRAESKIANKHYGIARMMWTKRNKKFLKQYGY